MTEQQPAQISVEPVSDRGVLRVTIALPNSPHRFVLYVDQRRRDDGSLAYAVTEAAVTPQGGDADPKAIAAATVRELADRFERLSKVAYDAVDAMFGNGERVAPRVRTRRQLTPDFLRAIVVRHNELRQTGTAPTQALAREQRVSDGAVKKWLRRAREQGIEAS